MMGKNNIYKRIVAFVSMAVLAFSLTACGGQEQTVGEEQGEAGTEQSAASGYVYVPEFVELSSNEDSQNMNSPQLQGEDLYFQSYSYDEETETGGYRFYRKNLQTGETTELPFQFGLEEFDNYYPMGSLFFDRDGNMFCLISASSYSEGSSSNAYFLYKFDSQGNQLSKLEITEALAFEEGTGYIQQAALDSQGRIYAVVSITGNNLGMADYYIVVIDAEGNTLASINTNTDWISSIGVTEDDTVLITRYSESGSGMECVEVDVTGKTLGRTYSGMPSSYNSNSLNPAPEGGLLVNDGQKLWRYDLETESAEEILTWTDCNINGNYIQLVQALADGRIAVLSQDWEDNNMEIAFLTKTEASEVAQKQIITVATLWSNSDLQEAVVDFNKQSDTYQVRIDTYFDENSEWTENKYQDSITALNNAITSSNCPDIIDLSYGNPSSYVSKGLLTREEGRLYSRLLQNRITGDYNDFFDFAEEDVLPLVDPVRHLLDKLESLINV